MRNGFLFCFILFSAAARGNDSVTPEEFANTQTWLRLLHYQKSFAQYQSRVVNSSFFLSPGGRANPKSELEATLEEFAKVEPASDKHAQCRFPARYEVLKKHFALAPKVHCQELDGWFQEYKPTRVSYVYASQYVSNPTSVFGHSFFLFSSTEINEYLWATFNYAATIPDATGAVGYVLKGLSGGFTGNFDIMPFYQRIQIYNNYENRDLWLYELHLSDGERTLLIEHLWELANQAELRYYFLYENCSGVLLAALEAILPEFNGLKEFSVYIPPGEVPKVLKRHGLLAKLERRPALNKQLQQKISALPQDDREIFFKAQKSQHLTAAAQENPRLLEALMDSIDVLFAKNKGVLEPATLDFKKQVFLARARHGVLPEPRLPELKLTPPHESHDPMKFSIGGVQRNSLVQGTIGFRPLIHGFMDRNAGYLLNSEIEVLDLRMRIIEWTDVRFDYLTLAAFQNIRPIDHTDRPLSWQLKAGFEKNPYHPNLERNYFYSHVALGGSVNWGELPLTHYLLLSNDWKEGARSPLPILASGPLMGQILEWKHLRWHVAAKYLFPVLKTPQAQEYALTNEFRINPARNLAIDLKARWRRIPLLNERLDEYELHLSYFF
jgi:hypothetical protein